MSTTVQTGMPATVSPAAVSTATDPAGTVRPAAVSPATVQAGSEQRFYTSIDSPIGELLLLGDGHTLRGLYMQEGRKPVKISSQWERSQAPFANVIEQLREYFAGERTNFDDLPLTLDGGQFERRVWLALQEIPYGETASYGEIARHVGQPGAARAVGLANGRNPIAVIVPCHRVIGANGTLVGYGGGLERKRLLLELEQGQSRLRL
jgi:methylated-DNA-[protein]-cysteine S-methyltransferase